MFTPIARLQTVMRLVPVVAMLFFIGFAEAEEPLHLLQQRQTVQGAEIDLIKAQLDLESWKQSQLEVLHRDGFASWLETRRHQLTVDSIAARLQSAVEFQDFLAGIASQHNSLEDPTGLAYHPRETKPIKIFLPGSVRIIGWIEGQSLVDSAEDHSNGAVIKIAQEKLAKAQQRFDIVAKLPAATAAVRQSALLRRNLARQELKHLEAIQEFAMSDAVATSTSITLDEVEHLVTAEADRDLRSATKLVAKAEAAAMGHIKSAQIMLAREQRRADAIADWQAHGHASEKELKIVNERLAELNSQLEDYLENQSTLEASLSGFGNTVGQPGSKNYEPVHSWPEEIFADQQFVFHLVDLRRNYYREQALAELNRLKSEMLSEVLSRLQVAAAESQANGPLEFALTTGQQNEIKSYETDIEFAKANRLASIEKQQILVLEEKRFSHQAIAMHEAARNMMVSSPRQEFGLLAWSRLLHPAGAIASNGTTRKLTHCNYLESGNLHRTAAKSNLLFSQADLHFLGGPFSDTVCQYSLLPVDTSLMTSYAGRKLYNPRRLEIEPQWMSYFRKSQPRNVVSTYDFPQLWRNPYQHRVGQPFGNYWAYPNSVLRSDLRSRITPGQVPWYLPGSPSNIRSDQLKY